jgi:hypothetical protein
MLIVISGMIDVNSNKWYEVVIRGDINSDHDRSMMTKSYSFQLILTYNMVFQFVFVIVLYQFFLIHSYHQF